MKLIVAGSTGLVGKELVLQALSNPAVTSVVALSRREENYEHSGTDSNNLTKLVPVIVPDFEHYSTAAKEKFADADAVIWTVAITPKKAVGQDPEVVKRICDDYTFAGLDAITSARKDNKTTPLFFVYVSGMVVSRDKNALPSWVPEQMLAYLHMRCDIVNKLVERAEKAPHEIKLLEVRPGIITHPGLQVESDLLKEGVTDADAARRQKYPQIPVQTLCAALLDQVVNRHGGGDDEDLLVHDDLVRIGESVLSRSTQ